MDEKEHESEVLSKLKSADAYLAEENRGLAEGIARSALELVEHKLSEEHPLHAEATRVLGSLLLVNERGREALETVTPLLSPGLVISDDLAFLTARILAAAGRAGDAVRVLGRLTGAAGSANGPLPLAAPGAPRSGEPLLDRLLDRPPGTLAQSPDAHLALVDALLKQGRYPEALLTARKAVRTFANDTSPTVPQLRVRVADLERRLGPAV